MHYNLQFHAWFRHPNGQHICTRINPPTSLHKLLGLLPPLHSSFNGPFHCFMLHVENIFYISGLAIFCHMMVGRNNSLIPLSHPLPCRYAHAQSSCSDVHPMAVRGGSLTTSGCTPISISLPLPDRCW